MNYRKFWLVIIIFLCGLGVRAEAAVTVIPASGGENISADTVGGSWTVLTGPTIDESAGGNIKSGTITLTAPAGFEFDPSSPVTILLTGSATSSSNINNQPTGSHLSTTVTSSTISFTQTAQSASSNTLTWENIKVRPTAVAPLASGHIVASSTGLMVGLVLPVNIGFLNEVPGMAPVTHVLNITADHGVVTKNPDQASYDHGAVVELTATPDAGYTFSSWSGDLSTTTNPVSVTLDSDKNVTANFVVDPMPPVMHTITASSSAGGTISPSGTVSVVAGADQVFTLAPDAGFELSELLVDSATSTATSTYTFWNVMTDHSISALFTPVATSTATTTVPAENPESGAGGSNGANNSSSGGSAPVSPSGATVSDTDRARLLVLLESFQQAQVAQTVTGRVLGASTIAPATNLIPPVSLVSTTTTPTGGNVFSRMGRWIANLFGRLF